MRSCGAAYSRGWPAATVGDRLVKGMWNAEAHLGVFGTEGKGYDGVRTAWAAAGVGGMLPRMVLADSVDSVDVVRAVGSGFGLGVGLLKAPSRVGEMPGMGSSLMGDMRRDPRAWAWALLDEERRRARCCCCCSILSCRPRSLSTSISSGEASLSGASSLSSAGWLSGSLISVSVAPSSLRSLVGRVWGDDCDVCDWYGFASLAASLCSGGRAVGGVAVVSLLELGEGDGAFVIIAFPSLPRLAQVVS